MSSKKTKKINVSSLEKAGWIVEVGKKGDKKKTRGKVQTTFLDIKEDK